MLDVRSLRQCQLFSYHAVSFRPDRAYQQDSVSRLSTIKSLNQSVVVELELQAPSNVRSLSDVNGLDELLAKLSSEDIETRLLGAVADVELRKAPFESRFRTKNHGRAPADFDRHRSPRLHAQTSPQSPFEV